MWIKLNYNIEKLKEKIKTIENHDLSLFNKTTLIIDLLNSLGNIINFKTFEINQKAKECEIANSFVLLFQTLNRYNIFFNIHNDYLNDYNEKNKDLKPTSQNYCYYFNQLWQYVYLIDKNNDETLDYLNINLHETVYCLIILLLKEESNKSLDQILEDTWML